MHKRTGKIKPQLKNRWKSTISTQDIVSCAPFINWATLSWAMHASTNMPTARELTQDLRSQELARQPHKIRLKCSFFLACLCVLESFVGRKQHLPSSFSARKILRQIATSNGQWWITCSDSINNILHKESYKEWPSVSLPAKKLNKSASKTRLSLSTLRLLQVTSTRSSAESVPSTVSVIWNFRRLPKNSEGQHVWHSWSKACKSKMNLWLYFCGVPR